MLGLLKKSSADFQKKSGKIVGVFTKAINELTSINAEIEESFKENEVEIERLEEENEALEITAEENSMVIERLSELVHPSTPSGDEY